VRLIPRPLLAVLTLALATGAGIATASELVAGGEPPDVQLPELLPGPGAPVPGAVAADPDGGPAAWAVRTYVSQTWLLCAEAGRAVNGAFGDIDGEGRLVARPPGPTGTCADPHSDPLIATVRRIAGPPERTVVFGASGREPRSVTLAVGEDPPLPLPVGARGSFIGVLEGLRDPASVRLDATLGDGTAAHLGFGGASDG
jgi:hypothetical protein